MNVVSMLAAQVARRPEAAAIVEGPAGRGRTTTYADLDRRSREGAALLRASGMRPGDRVLILNRMSADLYVAFIAALRLGMVAVFVEASAGLRALDRCCAKARPKAFIGSPKAHLLRLLVPAVREIPVCFSQGLRVPGARAWKLAGETASGDPHDGIEELADSAPALLTLTSGSTGAPKAAVRSHGFLRAQYESLQRVLHLSAGEVDLTTLPIVALANLASGVTNVIPNVDLRFPAAIDPSPVLAQMDAHLVTRTAASPAFLDRLVDACIVSGRTVPQLERVFTGGGPVFPDLLDRLRRVAPNASISAVYGSSEAEPIAELAADDVNADDRVAMIGGRGLLAGQPVPSVALKILADHTGARLGPFSGVEFDAACLGPEQAGEIVVSGAHVLSGYLDGEGDEETKFRVDGEIWHRTGDAGLLDEDGRLWLLGRCTARVRDERGVLYPFAIECAAMHHPNVRRAALVAREGRRDLAVELRDRRESSGLHQLKQSLAWAGIESIHVYPRLPLDRRHNAKIDYGALQKLMERRPVETVG